MNIDIPEDLMKNVENRLKIHIRNKRRNRITMFSILMAVIIPTSVFAYNNYFSNDTLRPFSSPESSKYIELVHQSAKDKNIVIELNSILADDTGLDMGVVIQTSKDIQTDYNGPFLLKGDLIINGQKVKEYAEGITFLKKVGKNKYTGVINTQLRNLPKEFALEFNIDAIEAYKDYNQIATIEKGKWALKAKVNKESIAKNSLTKDINISKTFPEGNLKIAKVISTPLSLQVFTEADGINKINDKYQFFAVDDQDRELMPLGNLSYSPALEGNSDGTFTYKEEYDFIPLSNPPKTITLIPYKPGIYVRSISLNSNTPNEIDCGDLGKLTIKNISKEGSKFRISIIAEGMLPYSLAMYTSIIETETNNIKANCMDTIVNKARTLSDKVDFEIEFNDYDINKNYRLLYNSGMKIYKDRAITLNLR